MHENSGTSGKGRIRSFRRASARFVHSVALAFALGAEGASLTTTKSNVVVLSTWSRPVSGAIRDQFSLQIRDSVVDLGPRRESQLTDISATST
jgi:hypothetical protein